PTRSNPRDRVSVHLATFVLARARASCLFWLCGPATQTPSSPRLPPARGPVVPEWLAAAPRVHDSSLRTPSIHSCSVSLHYQARRFASLLGPEDVENSGCAPFPHRISLP